MLKVILTPIFTLFWRVEVDGIEHVPKDGPVVVAANHQSFCDSFFLPLVLRRRLTYVAKAEYFDNWRTAWFFRAAGQIPMNRSGGDASQRALDTAKQVLRSGGMLGIYPEGTRSPDERLHRGHTGAARLALGCDVPIIPVGISGTRRVQPPGRRLMRPFHPVRVRFGAPLTYEYGGVRITTGEGAARAAGLNGSGGAPTPDELRAVTDALMAAIASLSGQVYVDHYASRKSGTARLGDNGSPGSAAANALRGTLARRHLVTRRKQGVHTDGLA